MSIFLTACISIGLSVAAQFLLKAGARQDSLSQAASRMNLREIVPAVIANVPLMAGLVVYALSAVFWLFVLARWDVSKAYPIVGLGFGISIVVGLALGEAVSAQRFGGVALICLGVYVTARS